jgi:esterase/lipase superfamily enzyme
MVGNGKMQVNIMHCLNTFLKKPGAVRNSIALKSVPKLKAIFDTFYDKKPKDFIENLMDNKHLDIDEIIKLFQEKTANKAEFKAIVVVRPISRIDLHSRSSLADYAQLMKGDEPKAQPKN